MNHEHNPMVFERERGSKYPVMDASVQRKQQVFLGFDERDYTLRPHFFFPFLLVLAKLRSEAEVPSSVSVRQLCHMSSFD